MIKKLTILFALVIISANQLFAQLGKPEVEDVYGGRINAITGFALSADTTRIFISTESANSMFYTDVVHNALFASHFDKFTVMPGVDGAAGFGSGIQVIEAHPQSGKVFFAQENYVLSSHPDSSVVDPIYYHGYANDILIVDSAMIFVTSPEVHFGMLDSGGNFTESGDSPLSLTALGGMVSLDYNPIDSLLYICSMGPSIGLFRSTDKFYSLNSLTVFDDISPTTLSTAVEWKAFGIAPSGRLFIGGSDFSGKQFAYSDDDTTWTTYAGLGGASGPNFAFSGDSSYYHVYFASLYNDNNGMSGHWNGFGNPGGMMTHPNDGYVFQDPNNAGVVYMTTDQGLGASEDFGETIFEINKGIEAVQVMDFSMTPSKNTAWLAAKSGIRRVRDYRGTPNWTFPLFPMGDGSPYYSAEMTHYDSTIAYAGNVRVYKTTDDGFGWSRIFTPENAPYSFSGTGTRCLAIEECPWDSSIVFAGFDQQDSGKGGVFYSMDEGATWNQLLLEASSVGPDVDVTDIVFNLEGADTVAYIGVLYDLAAPTGRSVYRAVKSGSTWTASQDMNSGGTSTGSLIVTSVWDLYVDGDTVYAAGTDAGTNHPTIYKKPVAGSNLWTPITVTGFPFGTGIEATAVTVGNDTLYAAVGSTVYYYTPGATKWEIGYEYPVGTRINFLYFDELLVGTSTGLYAHFTKGSVTDVKGTVEEGIPDQFSLEQNYPNPFNPTTNIRFKLSEATDVQLIVYDILGREVATLVNGFKQKGIYRINFDAGNLTSGIYVYRLKTAKFSKTRKMMLLK